MNTNNNEKKSLLFTRKFHFLNEIELENIHVDKKILHKELNNLIWNNFEIDNEVREKLLEIAKEFYEFLGIKNKETEKKAEKNLFLESIFIKSYLNTAQVNCS